MAALSPKAQRLVQEGREALRPAAGDRERLEAVLAARLSQGAPNAGAGAGAGATRPLRPISWRLLPPVALGVALVGGAVFLALRPPAHVPSAPVGTEAAPGASVPASAAVQAPAESSRETPAEPAPSAAAAKASLAPPASAPHAQDGLAQEVALLTRATSDLRTGRDADALKALDEHQRKFPNGVLSMERRAVRAQALCSLKRVSEGRAELAHLAPQSPAAARARQVCDAASAANSKP